MAHIMARKVAQKHGEREMCVHVRTHTHRHVHVQYSIVICMYKHTWIDVTIYAVSSCTKEYLMV